MALEHRQSMSTIDPHLLSELAMPSPVSISEEATARLLADARPAAMVKLKSKRLSPDATSSFKYVKDTFVELDNELETLEVEPSKAALQSQPSFLSVADETGSTASGTAGTGFNHQVVMSKTRVQTASYPTTKFQQSQGQKKQKNFRHHSATAESSWRSASAPTKSSSAQLEKARLDTRIYSLPNYLCHTASGDPFVVELGSVQSIHQRMVLSPKQLAILHRIERQMLLNSHAADPYLDLSLLDDFLNHGISSLEKQDEARQGDRGRSDDGMMEDTMRKVANDADHFHPNPAVMAEVNRRFEAAIALLENWRDERWGGKSVDEKMTSPTAQGGKGWRKAGLAGRAAGSRHPSQASTTVLDVADIDLPMEPDLTELMQRAGPIRSHSKHWARVRELVLRMQDNWQEVEKHSKRVCVRTGMKASDAWDGALQLINYSLNRHSSSSGAGIYEMKCQELGIPASTAVIAALAQETANLGHSKLGLPGTLALSHALGINTTITALNLTGNAIDASALQELFRGIRLGFQLRPAGHTEASERGPKGPSDKARHWRKLGLLESRVHISEMASLVRPGPPALSSDPPRPQPLHPDGMPAPGSAAAILPPLRKQAGQAAKAGMAQNADDDPLAEHLEEGGRGHQLSQPSDLLDPANRRSSITRMKEAAKKLTSRLTELNLSDNPMGLSGAQVLADALNPMKTLQFLTKLVANKCGINDPGALALVAALRQGNFKLKILHLAHNALGSKSAAALGELLESNHALKELDISWNLIKAEGAKKLAAGLETNASLTILNIAWNGLEDKGVSAMGKMLQLNMGLRHLDLTNTAVGALGCLVLAEGLRHNVALEVLLMSNNPIGEDGARHLMQALSVNKTLQYLGVQGSNMSNGRVGGHENVIPRNDMRRASVLIPAMHFNPAAPSGTYCLDLALGGDRAVAIQLCDLELGQPEGSSPMMRAVTINGKTVANIRMQNWPANLPETGVLGCEISMKNMRREKDVLDKKKLASLLTQLRRRDVSDRERMELIALFSSHSFFTCDQASQCVQAFGPSEEAQLAAGMLFCRVVDAEDNAFKIASALNEFDLGGYKQLLGWFADYRWTANPSGHYELNLSMPIHQQVAQRLKDCAQHEPENAPVWINIVHDRYTDKVKTPASCGPPLDWCGVVPTSGSVSFDYVSHIPHPPSATPMRDDDLMELMDRVGFTFDELSGNPVRPQDFAEAKSLLATLRRTISVDKGCFFTCQQVARVMHSFKHSCDRVEAAVCLFENTLDQPDNLHLLVECLRGVEQSNLLWRLGPQVAFDVAHSTGHWFLDCSNPAHEDVIKKLVVYATANPEQPNMWNIRINGGLKQITENANMWGMITTETTTPYLEFDFFGPDSWEAAGKSAEDVAAMTPGEKLDFRRQQAARAEFARMQQLCPYFPTTKPTPHVEDWQTWGGLMKPLVEKAPQHASWDRLVRMLVRLERQALSDSEYDTQTEAVFKASCGKDGFMTWEQMEKMLVAKMGFSKVEAATWSEPFQQILRERPASTSPRLRRPSVVVPPGGMAYTEFLSLLLVAPA